MGFSRQEYWSGLPSPSPGDPPDPGIKPGSPALQADSLPAEPQGKPKTAGVGSLSLLQKIFPTQELNQGLLHCREILYQLNYQGIPPIISPVEHLFTCSLAICTFLGKKLSIQAFCSVFDWVVWLF